MICNCVAAGDKEHTEPDTIPATWTHTRYAFQSMTSLNSTGGHSKEQPETTGIDLSSSVKPNVKGDRSVDNVQSCL